MPYCGALGGQKKTSSQRVDSKTEFSELPQPVEPPSKHTPHSLQYDNRPEEDNWQLMPVTETAPGGWNNIQGYQNKRFMIHDDDCKPLSCF